MEHRAIVPDLFDIEPKCRALLFNRIESDADFKQ